MLSLRITRSGRAVQITCDDDAGITKLTDTTATKLRGSGSHVHLRSQSIGGSDLSEKSRFGEAATAEVIMTHGED